MITLDTIPSDPSSSPLSFTDFEDTFSVPRSAIEADAPEDLASEPLIFTIKFGQYIFDMYYSVQTAPTTSPIAHAKWDKRRLELADCLKGAFVLPEDFAKTLYEQLSDEEGWKKTQVYPTATYKDGTEKVTQLTFAGAALFEKSLSTLVEKLIAHFDTKGK